MHRSVLIFSAFLVFVFVPLTAQSTATPRKLESVVRELEAHPDVSHDPQWAGGLDSIVQSTTPDEINRVLPATVSLTESSNSQLRGAALLVLYAIANRQDGLAGKSGGRDLAADKAIVPFLPRLEPRLMDSSNPCRGMSLLLFQALTAITPTPPELITAALRLLKNPQSTCAMPDTTPGSLRGSGTSPGPQILWILLPAGATYYLNPETHITEGRDSPEVQSAIIEFLHRPDQTTESLLESIRALTVSQVQNPAVNAALLPLLNSSDVEVQKALLGQVARLTCTPNDFASARNRVKSIETDPNSPADLQKLAGSLLSRWSDDRHQDACPTL